MKKIHTLAFLFLFSASFAQTIVNQSVATTFDSASKVYTSVQILPDGYGNYIAMSNYYNTYGQNNNLTLVRYTPGVGVYVGFEYSTYGAMTLGTDMYINGGFVYLVGATTDSTGSHSVLCNTAKIALSNLDSTLWLTTVNLDSTAIQQSPFAVAADDSGNVYMGATVQTAAGTRMAIVKYNSSGAQLWITNYDTVGFSTVPVAMSLNAPGTILTVTGFDFDGLGNSYFVTAEFTVSTGALFGEKYSANGTGAISHPIGIVTDTSGDLYIAGTSTVAGMSSVIKIIRYDASFDQQWVSTWGDSSVASQAVAMAIDVAPTPYGHVVVTGSSPNTSGGTDLVVLRFNNADGGLAWSRRLSAPNPAYGAAGVAIAEDAYFNTYVTGTMYNGTDTNIVTAAYDSAGTLLWMKTYSRTPSSSNAPYSILVSSSSNSIYVTGRSFSTDSVYMMLEYDQWNPTPCGDSVCPSITYVFENGKLDTVGTDTFVEFDIYAMQNDPSLNYEGGNIVFTYSNSIFGTDVVDSGNITVTPGTITADTSAYSISVSDTLFKSDALPSNGGEVWLSIASIGSPYYAIADTLQQLCHVKMKMQHEGDFEINFDQFFMEGQSDYFSLTSQEYTEVYTGSHLGMSSRSNASITYTITNVQYTGGIPPNFSPTTVSFDINVIASNAVSVADAGIYLTFDNTVVSLNYNNVNPPAWSSNQYDGNSLTSTGDVYSVWPIYNLDAPTTDDLYMQVNYNSSQGDPYDPTDIPAVHQFTTTSSGETFISVTMSLLDCTHNPNVHFAYNNSTQQWQCSRAVTNDYGIPGGGGTYTIANYNITTVNSTDLLNAFCVGIENIDSNSAGFNIYPNPFSQILSVNIHTSENTNIVVDIMNTLGQTIYSQSLGQFAPGSYQRKIDVPNELSSGVYFAHMRGSNGESVVKLIKE